MIYVNFWGSNPNEGNDDLHSVNDECKTLAEAKAIYYKDAPYHIAYIELDAPGFYEKRRNPAYKASPPDTLWRNENRMQAAMACGCEGWNEN